MIILPLKKTHELEQLELIVPRYQPHDQQFQQLQNQFGRELAGYKGEKTLQHFLNSLKLDDHYILYGFRSRGVEGYFQIDTIIITLKFILIVENKHLRGTLSINDAKQLIQDYQGHKEIYDNPEMQAKIQKYHLSYLLEKLNLNQLPIYTCATFTHPKVELQFERNITNMFTVQNLLSYIYQIHQKHPNPILSKNSALNIAQTLKDHHYPKSKSVLEEFKISDVVLRKGVWCTNHECQHAMMDRVFGNWLCQKCGHTDRYAHFHTLKEFAIIYNTCEITNKMARNFLNVKSRYITNRILDAFDQTGNTKGASYSLKALF